jgi:hypothetical protein
MDDVDTVAIVVEDLVGGNKGPSRPRANFRLRSETIRARGS